MSLIVKSKMILLLSSAFGPRLCLPPHSGSYGESDSSSEPGSSTEADAGSAEMATTGATFASEGMADPTSITSLTVTASDPDSSAGDETSSTTSSTVSSGTTENPPVCGDGEKDPEEECDDCIGLACEVIDLACLHKNCTNEGCEGCIPAICGDGVVNWSLGVLEECEPSGDEACTSTCKLNHCGDGEQLADEECDLGTLDNGDNKTCRDDCTLNLCGNSTADQGEECDDGNLLSFDTCSDLCELEFVAFVTQAPHSGNLGGVSGANVICQQAADTFLKGQKVEFKAWIAGAGGTAPWTKFQPLLTQIQQPILSRDGAVIVNAWPDLLNGMLANELNVDENADPLPEGSDAWTGIQWNAFGYWLNVGEDCKNWKSDDAEVEGWFGGPGSINQAWTDGGKSEGCDQMKHLYCFSQ